MKNIQMPLKPLTDCALTMSWVKQFQREEKKYNLASVWECDLTSCKLWPRVQQLVAIWKKDKT